MTADHQMPEDEMRAAIEASARCAVLFEPIYPPVHASPATTFFGGRPLLPPEIDWPVQRVVVGSEPAPDEPRGYVEIEAPVALTFLGQIDLGRLPPAANIALLPKRGTLYFFLDTATEDFDFPKTPGTGGKVIYWPGDSARCAERPEPELLRPCYGDLAELVFKWLKPVHADECLYPKSFAKWPIRPIPVPVYEADYPGGIETFYELRESMNAAQLAAALPAAVERNYFVWDSAPHGEWRGGPGFPYTWICVEVFCGAMIDAFASVSGGIRKLPKNGNWKSLKKNCSDGFSAAAPPGHTTLSPTPCARNS